MSDATKKQLDDAHEAGVRDGKAGSDNDPPAATDVVSQVSDMVAGDDSASQINDAYRRGRSGGENQGDDEE
jgi:hypothetical protein